MAADLDLTAAPPGFGRAVAAVAALALGAAILLLVLLTGWAAVTLLGCVVAGAGLTYLSQLPLTAEERLAYGTVIGALVVASVEFVLALAVGLGLGTVLAGLWIALALSLLGWRRADLRSEATEALARWRRREPWPLWLLLAVCWPFTLVVLSRAYTVTGAGLVAGGAAFYADWAAHLTYAGSFAFGHNFPPQFPVDPGHRMAYPFLVDFFGAALVPLGTSLTSALVLSSGLLALAFPAVMYLAGVRLTGSRAGSALGVLVFVLGGGLGFFPAIADAARAGSLSLLHLPHLATQDPARNYQWLNPVLAWMLPQRSVLFGFSLALLVMAMLWLARDATSWAPFAFAGVVAGLTPLAHLHAYGTIVALAAFWTLLSPRRQWAAFFVPALVLGLPPVLWTLGGGAASLRVQLWWLADVQGHKDGPVWFWLKNTGLLVPAMAAAFLWRGLLPAGVARHLAPIWLWFLVPNVLVFQPWDWDNTKFFAYWALIGALPVGALLARLFRGGTGTRLLAGGLAAVLMLAGALDLARSLDPALSAAPFTDAAGVQTAEWVRDNTDPQAVFLVAPDHNEPIPTLAGRRVVVGYGGWLWTYGLSDWVQKTADAGRMLRGEPGTPDLLRQYGVGYVVVGPAETGANYRANAAYWNAAADRVYTNGDYSVYRVR